MKNTTASQGRKNLHVNGLGIGLFLVKTIVDKYKGKISVKSNIDKGVTFKIQIPNPEIILKNKPVIKDYQLAILDVMLPFMDGFELSKEIWKTSEIPFLFLTAKGQSIDKILGLKLGADDYITKPCEPEELILRIKNILKRQQNTKQEIIKIGNYSFIPSQFQLVFDNEKIKLTEKESELLLLLSRNNQKIINRKEILENLWGENDYFLGRSLDVFMTRLRKYLQKDDRIKLESVRGIGFKVEFPK